MKPMWHVVWNTYKSLPPKDRRGSWNSLAHLYSAIDSNQVEICSPLHKYYSELPMSTVTLSEEERVALAGMLEKLTAENGVRIAGGCTVLAAAFGTTSAHIVFRCDERRLSQVVGRLKSRLACLLLNFSRRISTDKDIWGKGFWYSKLLHTEAGGRLYRRNS